MNHDLYQLALLSVFVLIISTRYMISVAKGIHPILILSREKPASEKAVEFLPVAGVGLASLLVLRRIFTPQIWPFLSTGFEVPLYLQLTGLIVALFSFIPLVMGYRALGPNWRVGLGDEEKSNLVTGGIFAYTRNPVYIFFYAFFTGLFLLNGDYSLLLLSLVVVVSLHIQVLQEEKALYRRFGEVYLQYREKVPRYFFYFKK